MSGSPADSAGPVGRAHANQALGAYLEFGVPEAQEMRTFHADLEACTT